MANKESLQRQREMGSKTYHPFYAVGDFNSDNREDFAVILVTSRGRNRQKNGFAVAVFDGPFRQTQKISPSFFEESLEPGDWLFYRPDSGLIIGPPESDNCFIVQPRDRSYVIKDCIS